MRFECTCIKFSLSIHARVRLVGDNLLQLVNYKDKSRVQRQLPILAPRALAAQFIHAGIYWIIMAWLCLTVTCVHMH